MKNKPAQLPIYRATERLMLWCIPIVERIPKSLPYQVIGTSIITNLMNGLDAVILASQAVGTSRLAYLNILIEKMTLVKTSMRMLKASKVISPKQEVQFLDLINPVAIQAGAWRQKIHTEFKNSDK